jgi:hypothetical protein
LQVFTYKVFAFVKNKANFLAFNLDFMYVNQCM